MATKVKSLLKGTYHGEIPPTKEDGIMAKSHLDRTLDDMKATKKLTKEKIL